MGPAFARTTDERWLAADELELPRVIVEGSINSHPLIPAEAGMSGA